MPLAAVLIPEVHVVRHVHWRLVTDHCMLQAAPAAVEAITKLTAFRGFAGTSVLIIVGVATDTARKVHSQLSMRYCILFVSRSVSSAAA
jgi:hypothetical protein